MESRAKFLGHPIHQMLVPLPFGLLAMAVVFDILSWAFGSAMWAQVAYWMIASGVVTGLIAAPFGFIDWLAVPPRTRAKRIGAVHGIGNLFVIVLFAMSWARRGGGDIYLDIYATALAVLGGALALFTGWLGGELVDRLGVGVDTGAHVNAPSSIKSRRVA